MKGFRKAETGEKGNAAACGVGQLHSKSLPYAANAGIVPSGEGY